MEVLSYTWVDLAARLAGGLMKIMERALANKLATLGDVEEGSKSKIVRLWCLPSQNQPLEVQLTLTVT